MKRIVIVEDDIYMREELEQLLKKSNYEVDSITNFNLISEQIKKRSPDLTLLDINLPVQSGFEICRELKGIGIWPILILTARDRLQDELHALELGADEYLTKPCNSRRLLARIENLLNRADQVKRKGLVNGGDFHLDSCTFTVYTKEHSFVLPPNEGKLLLSLLKHFPDMVVKDVLARELWGTDIYIDENALQVNITRLRRDMKDMGLDDRIETIRGKGYRLRKNEE